MARGGIAWLAGPIVLTIGLSGAVSVVDPAAGAVPLGPLAVAAAPGDGQQELAMAQTVLDQLAAFRRGDWPGAYAFASASIRARFTVEAFREMVTRGYGPIAQPLQSQVRSALVLDSQRGYVELRVEGRDGDAIDALYELVLEQGQWRINGVIARPVSSGELVRAGAGGVANARLPSVAAAGAL